MSYQLKLIGPNGETRRLTFSTKPSWLDLEQKITSLFGMQDKAIAVSYEDSDGDIITMSSQEELEDYFHTSHELGQMVKFFVVDKSKSQNASQKNSSVFVEDHRVPQAGLPTMGPTMVIEVDDGGWQHLPRVPGMFSIPEEGAGIDPGEGHAFVEVLDSDAESQKESDGRVSPSHSSRIGMSTRQWRRKDKQKAPLDTEATKSTSSASIVNNDFPTKPPVHVYDVSDAGRSPLGSARDLPERPMTFSGSAVKGHLSSFGTVFPVSPPQDAYKQIPRASDALTGDERDRYHGSASVHSESVPSTHLKKDMPSQVLGNTAHGTDERSESRTPTLQQTTVQRPSFIQDVANLVDDVTIAFVSHPELSEGVRDIIRNATSGTYWNAEHERIAGIAENVRVAAEETSSRITRAAGGLANNAERDTVHIVAEALEGVFRVIAELSADPSRDQPTEPFGPPPPPVAHVHHRIPHEQLRYPAGWDEVPHRRASRLGRWDPYHNMSHRRPGLDYGYQTFGPVIGSSKPWHSVPTGPYGQRSNTWGPGQFVTQHLDGSMNDDDDTHGAANRPNLHDTKAQLEAAKTVYKAEKERFRQEKEERRRRREIALKRTEGRIHRPDGTTREEEIIARIPLHKSPRDGAKHLFAKDHGTSSYSPGISGPVPLSSYPPPAQTAPGPSPRRSIVTTSVYSTVDPIPAIPRASIPVPVTAIPANPPAPPIPPPPAVPAFNFGRSASAPSVNATQRQPATTPKQPTGVASASGPYPWPVPPVRDPSRRKHLTTLRERIQTRLFDMGITAASQPDMMDILNICTSRTDSPDDGEVLADVLSAMNIRGSPSPRPESSRLPH